MGFYDKEIKKMCESCPRLFIMMINSIFQKHHAEDAEIIFLDKEQNIDSHESTTYMDMLISIEGCHYHIEYQLLEGNMAIRILESPPHIRSAAFRRRHSICIFDAWTPPDRIRI